MSRAFVKEGDGAASGSVSDRFYQGLLGLTDAARELIGRRQEQTWVKASNHIEQARAAAQEALGADSYKEIFEAAADRVEERAQTPVWWAAGDAATALAVRRRVGPDQFAMLVGPLAVALPWLKDVGGQT